VLLNSPAGLLEVPASNAGEQVHSRTTATGMVFASALVAVPAAVAIVTIPAVAVVTAACWAWLVFVGELLRR
jgi:hypothetical protein